MEGNHLLRHFFSVIRSFQRQITGGKKTLETQAAPPAPTPPPLPDEDRLRGDEQATFPPEMFARLLMELPDHRMKLASAYDANNLPLLKDRVHLLLGGAVYCNVPQITKTLSELRRALKTDDPQTIRYYYLQAMETIDSTLMASGYRG